MVLVAGACGDDDSASGSDDELVGGLTQLILDDTDTGDVPFTEQDAACFAKGLVNELGGARMVEAMEMEFEEFMDQASAAERREVVDIMLECVDFGGLLTAEFSTAISAESSQCLSDAFVGSSAFRDALADSFGTAAADPFDDPAVQEELIPAMFNCLSAEELVQLGNE
jgi:hypothetical protein